MRISKPDVNDQDTVDQLLWVHRAAHQADEPDNPGPCGVSFPVHLRQIRPAVTFEHRAAWVGDRVVAHLEMSMPTKDNTQFCEAEIVVHPDFRRRGIGTALLREAERIARVDRRRSISVGTLSTWQDGPRRSEAGRRFLEVMGYDLALTEVLRRSDLASLDAATEQELYDRAQAASTGYETIAWTVRTPEELLAPVAKLNGTFLDEAPLGDLDLTAETIDVERKRVVEQLVIERGIFMCGVLARPKGGTEVVANTVIGLKSEPGDVADQWMTLVAPEHRGHKLGLRIKLENHRQLLAARPAVRSVFTGNADVNAAMIGINEQLGFKPVDAWYAYQKDVTKTS